MEQNHAAGDIPLADLEQLRTLLTDFASCADRGDGAGLGALFLDEGTLLVGGQELVGREAISNDCLRRAAIPGRKTRHLWSNLRVEQADARSIVTVAMQLTFEQIGAEPAKLRVNDLSDVFHKDVRGRWRIARREIRNAMALTF